MANYTRGTVVFAGNLILVSMVLSCLAVFCAALNPGRKKKVTGSIEFSVLLIQ